MKKPISILLIEDDSDDQLFFIEAISSIENATLYAIAGHGKEALDLLEQSTVLPDFIFSDINMPFMDGIECLSELKMNPRIKNIPVIMLSTSVAQSTIACQLGAKAFVKKPNSINLLHDQIDKIINDDFIFASHMLTHSFQALPVAA